MSVASSNRTEWPPDAPVATLDLFVVLISAAGTSAAGSIAAVTAGTERAWACSVAPPSVNAERLMDPWWRWRWWWLLCGNSPCATMEALVHISTVSDHCRAA